MNLPIMWRTREGREVLIVEMGDQHLRNTIAMLRRKEAEIEQLGVLSVPEFAEFEARLRAHIQAMCKELETRCASAHTDCGADGVESIGLSRRCREHYNAEVLYP